ncbi:MAG: GTPase domain-containing protein [Candidatus Riflebacteria bacterium]|nr:GTPase domain-containing protein [Candidatus Riflebacteria bacterium]
MFEISELRQLIDESRQLSGRPKGAILEETLKRVEMLSERKDAVSDTLMAVMLGGTKVGKSTLLNALAGKQISEVSAKACFTSRPIVYVHSTREGQARLRLQGVLTKDDLIIVHNELALERIIIIDSPDIDGSVTIHHQVFRELLIRADLVMCVLTTQKYDSSPLYEILTHEVGFRRTVFIFNKIDEGIPYSETVKKDFLRKIADFNLKAPDGEEIPIFGISSYNAFMNKQGTTVGPAGEFKALENFLYKRLDQALIKRISEENLDAMFRETVELVGSNCRIQEMVKFAEKLVILAEEQFGILEREIAEVLTEIWSETSQGLEGRMTLNAISGISGPFGIYLKAIVAVRALTSTFTITIPSIDKTAGLFGKTAIDRIEKNADEFVTLLTEESDAADIEYTILKKRFLLNSKPLRLIGDEPAAILKKQLGETISRSWEGLLLNLLPAVILLLLLKYFLVCLFNAREPSAGMFLGGGLALWLVCYLQSAFWLPRKIGRQIFLPQELITHFTDKASQRIVQPIKAWRDEVNRLSENLSSAVKRN